MGKCTKVDCTAEATRALRLDFFAQKPGASARAFINLPVCNDHNLTDDEVREFLRINWEALCLGFEQVGKMRPKPELTEFAWVPLIEAEAFWREGIGNPTTQQIRKN